MVLAPDRFDESVVASSSPFAKSTGKGSAQASLSTGGKTAARQLMLTGAGSFKSGAGSFSCRSGAGSPQSGTGSPKKLSFAQSVKGHILDVSVESSKSGCGIVGGAGGAPERWGKVCKVSQLPLRETRRGGIKNRNLFRLWSRAILNRG